MLKKYSFKNKIISHDLETKTAIVELDTFSITSNPSAPVKKYHGNYFPFLYGVHHPTLINDYLGGYLQIKDSYPDLKIIFFKNTFSEEFENFSKDFVELFNAEIIDVNSENVFFEKIVLIGCELPVIPQHVYTDHPIHIPELEPNAKLWKINSLKKVVPYLDKHIKTSDNQKKVYITRSLFNKKYDKDNDEWNTYRIHNALYDDNLDNLFNKKGYGVFEFSYMPFFKQAQIARSSKIFISIEGSALQNAVWCDKDSTIVSIRVNKKYIDYGYYWEDLVNAIEKKNFINIDISSLTAEEGIKKIFSVIDDLN
jgi:hypothetical protein